VGALGLSLTACATSHDFATLSDGACKAFPRPTYQVKGKTAYDQRWADETTEAGIAGCHWQRPLKRPASLDPMPLKAVAKAIEPTVQPWPDQPLPVKKPSLLQRLRSRFHHKH
jgi:hypothetical protein